MESFGRVKHMLLNAFGDLRSSGLPTKDARHTALGIAAAGGHANIAGPSMSENSGFSECDCRQRDSYSTAYTCFLVC